MDNREINKTIIIESLVWKLFERVGTQGIQLVIQIILARILVPSDFGTIAIVMVFISLAQVFIQSGFNTALIQSKDSDDIDFSSVFYLSLLISFVIYALIYFCSPLIARFYNDALLIPVLRVLGLILFLGAYNSIQNAYIARNMLFKKLFYSSLWAVIGSGIVGIFFAYRGLGVWALIIQQMVNQIITVLILNYSVSWKPQLVFSLERVKILFSFGSKLLISSLINVLDINIRTLVIGRTYSPTLLGYYNRGEQFPKLIVSNLDGSIQSVMLPALSRYQDDRVVLKEMVRRSIITSSFIVFPLMIGLAAVAEPFISFLLTDKWLPSVPFLQILCLSYAVMPIHTANLQAINAMGRSDIFLKLEVLKKAFSIAILLISINYGIYAIALGLFVSSVISSIINAYPNHKLLNYSFTEQIYDVFPSMLLSLLMGIAVHFSKYLIDASDFYVLVIQVLVGAIFYIGLATLFKFDSIVYLSNFLKTIRFMSTVKKRE